MMLWKTLKSVVVLACAVLALGGPSASATDKKDDKDKARLSGVWGQKEGEVRIEFADENVMKISPHGENEVILIVCKYTVGKDGRVKARITDLEGKEEVKAKAKGVVPVGLEFSFKWQVKDDTATLDDLKGDNVESVKSHLEGKYEKK
jgi:hypothetical protein